MTTPDIEIIRRRARALVELAQEWGYVLTIETKPEQPLAMGNHFMAVDVRPARELDPVTLAMIEDHEQALRDAEDDDDEDDICSACNGSGEGMYDGSTCYKCHGHGHERPERDEDY